MTSQILQSSNLVSWVVQVFAIASLGAFLPLVFRIRHPRTQLAYSHLVLAVCLVLPLIQPWQHAMASSEIAHSAAVLGIGWDRIASGILAGGLCRPTGMAGGRPASNSSLSNGGDTPCVRFRTRSALHAIASARPRFFAFRPE